MVADEQLDVDDSYFDKDLQTMMECILSLVSFLISVLKFHLLIDALLDS